MNLASLSIRAIRLTLKEGSVLNTVFYQYLKEDRLKKISLTLDLHHYDHAELTRILSAMTQLEVLSLDRINGTGINMNQLQDCILNAPNLHSVYVTIGSIYSLEDLLDFFLNVAKQSSLSFLTLDASDEGQLFLDEDQLRDILSSNRHLSKLSLNDGLTSNSTLESGSQLYPLFESNHSLQYFSSYVRDPALDAESDNEDEDMDDFLVDIVYRQDRELWRQTTNEAAMLVKVNRLLSFYYSNGTTRRLPLELILYILSPSFFVTSSLWDVEELKMIMDGLRDKRTLGMIYTPVTEFDKNVLYVRCKRALDRLKV